MFERGGLLGELEDFQPSLNDYTNKKAENLDLVNLILEIFLSADDVIVVEDFGPGHS